MRGSVQASLELCCQRCLEPMYWQATIEVATRFSVAGVEGVETASELESIPLDDDGGTSLRDMVEDEVLLAMPQFARHDEQDCPVHLEREAPSEPASRENPFAVLAKLKASD